MDSLEILCIVVAICLFLYYYSTSNHDFWKNKGVRGPKPLPFIGNFKDLMLTRLSQGDFSKKYYDEFKDEPMVGIYAINNVPMLILNDPDLIKEVLIKDFNSFTDRGMSVHEKIDPLSQHLVFLEAERWRPLRRKLSPVFTSGKLKEMFYLLEESSHHLDKYLEKLVPINEPIECRQLTSKFTMNVIGSCAFGINVNAFSDEQNELVQMGKKLFDTSVLRAIRFIIKAQAPWLFQFMALFCQTQELETAEFFQKLVTDTMNFRKENNVKRHDFLDLLRFIKETPDKLDDIELTDSLLTAQAFVFFVAGFETSSTTMTHALYELAQSTIIQDKLRQEIQEELKRSGGKLTYDGVKSMKYLHKVFQETLRKYPAATMLRRSASNKYTFSGTKVTIPKDTKIWIPIYAIQRDPNYYPDPEVFDPERFDNDAVKSRHPMVYLPFGDGPRNCIGERFAVFQTKVGLIKIIQNFKVDVCDKTPIPYINNPRAMVLSSIGGMYLKFSKVSY